MSFQERAKLGFGAVIQTIASYLNDGAQTSGNLEIEKHFKKQKTKRLEQLE